MEKKRLNNISEMFNNKDVQRKYGLGDIFWLKFHRTTWWPSRWATEVEINNLPGKSKSMEGKWYMIYFGTNEFSEVKVPEDLERSIERKGHFKINSTFKICSWESGIEAGYANTDKKDIQEAIKISKLYLGLNPTERNIYILTDDYKQFILLHNYVIYMS